MRPFDGGSWSARWRRGALTAAAACLLGSLLLARAADREAPPRAGPTADDLVDGQRLFQGLCARCHGLKGEGGLGANLKRPVLRHASDDNDLLAVIREGIPGTAMPRIFAMTDREAWQVVGYVRALGRAAPEPAPGDPRKGIALYEKHNCAQCHIVRGAGGNSGPELSDIGVRRGLEFLRNAVLHPGREMSVDANGYTAYLVVVAVTRDGRVFKGTRLNEDSFTIQLRDEQNRLLSLRKRDLEVLEKTSGSLMPDYAKVLTPVQIDDLISYLANLRGTP